MFQGREFKKYIFAFLTFSFFTLIGLLTSYRWSQSQGGSSQLSSEQDIYTEKVQTVFNSRCIACHSCLESPCQLNLQAYEGLSRGIMREDVYNGFRMKPMSPTKLFEDASSTDEWREKGFHDIVGNSDSSILFQALLMGQGERVRPKLSVKESRSCINENEHPDSLHKFPELAMPYGLPGISATALQDILQWIHMGAPPPARRSPTDMSANIRDQVRTWTAFFNDKTNLKAQIVSRYLFEHLYLAHFYFKESPREFLKLIRSSQPCEIPKNIATRKPNSDPGISEFYYCFVKELGTIVSKNHIPYELSSEKMQWLRGIFLDDDWKATQFPSYQEKNAANPFSTFKEIPVKARYRFLIEDAQYNLMTFIKGPVCNGSVAVNSIQEQFYIFFMSPDSDLMVRSAEFAKTVEKEMKLPGQQGNGVGVTQILPSYSELVAKRNLNRKMRNVYLKEQSPDGLALKDIWDGDGTNENAVLTVFRHDDNAAVMKGAKGDLSKTAFVLDYWTFERLVYNLAVNFDVYGNIGHQALTRLYMDLIRMDAENNFLDFLPTEQRKKIKSSWYEGLFTQIRLYQMDENQFPQLGQKNIQFENPENSQLEFVRKILFERMSERARGSDDVINWKKLKKVQAKNIFDIHFQKIAGVHVSEKPFPKFFPELSFLIIGAVGQPRRVYSIIHNREHQNVSWMFNESSRLDPENDSLTIEPGIYGSYPNQFFYVEPESFEEMVREIFEIKSKSDYEKFKKKYIVDRMDPKIWSLYDFVNAEFLKIDPIRAGTIDLSRYNQ